VGGSRLLRAGGTVDEAGARGQAWGATTEAREVQRRLRAAPSELCEAVGGSSWSVEGRSASWNDCRLGTGTTSQKLSSSYRNPMVKDEPELHRGSDQG
jgi:hypothetical protein